MSDAIVDLAVGHTRTRTAPDLYLLLVSLPPSPLLPQCHLHGVRSVAVLSCFRLDTKIQIVLSIRHGIACAECTLHRLLPALTVTLQQQLSLCTTQTRMLS